MIVKTEEELGRIGDRVFNILKEEDMPFEQCSVILLGLTIAILKSGNKTHQQIRDSINNYVETVLGNL